MAEKLFLKVKDGNVRAVNEAGNPRTPYYSGGDCERAYWGDKDGYVELYLKNGTILILNRGGNLVRKI